MTESIGNQLDIPAPATLEQAVRERDAWIETAMTFSKNEEYYRGLVDAVARHLGPDVFVCDDGSVSEGPLRAKVPELVAALAARVA